MKGRVKIGEGGWEMEQKKEEEKKERKKRKEDKKGRQADRKKGRNRWQSRKNIQLSTWRPELQLCFCP